MARLVAHVGLGPHRCTGLAWLGRDPASSTPPRAAPRSTKLTARGPTAHRTAQPRPSIKTFPNGHLPGGQIAGYVSVESRSSCRRIAWSDTSSQSCRPHSSSIRVTLDRRRVSTSCAVLNSVLAGRSRAEVLHLSRAASPFEGWQSRGGRVDDHDERALPDARRVTSTVRSGFQLELTPKYRRRVY